MPSPDHHFHLGNSALIVDAHVIMLFADQASLKKNHDFMLKSDQCT